MDMGKKTAPSPQEMLEMAKEANTKKETKVQEEKFDGKLILSNNRVLEIKPVKLKYFKNGDFGSYQAIQTLGLTNVLQYKDGFDLVYIFLSAVFDKPYEKIEEKDDDGNYTTSYEFDEYITDLVDDELTVQELQDIIKAALEVNGIKENFLTPLAATE